MVFAGNGSFVERTAIVKRELGHTVAIEDLDLEKAPVVHTRVAAFGHGELEVELIIAEVLVGHDVRAPAVITAEQGRGRRASRATGSSLPGSDGSSRTSSQTTHTFLASGLRNFQPARVWPLKSGFQPSLLEYFSPCGSGGAARANGVPTRKTSMRTEQIPGVP